ncbi:hypothetical protein RGQ29_008916 [Quercus rubra]|uniref:DNA/RNA-binding protein Alba-like domain-containing protein n=1 Tax=Quercus rubra TaxID=3512 RepID=A0AAN7HZN5_QUERU|nr:hypothetical protein RGQ29_008916 [Quercus rubra]
MGLEPQIQSTAPIEPQKKNRILVSNTKKPLFFYRYSQKHNEVELSALGMVVTISEILKNNGLATEKILISTVGMKDENKGCGVQKAKIEIVLGRTEKFDSLMTTAATTPTTTEPSTAFLFWVFFGRGGLFGS